MSIVVLVAVLTAAVVSAGALWVLHSSVSQTHVYPAFVWSQPFVGYSALSSHHRRVTPSHKQCQQLTLDACTYSAY